MPPHTRRPIERITGIHDAVRRGRFPNCRTLAETFEVTPKTVQRDVTYMRESLELPLAYDEQKHGYYYTEPVSNFPLLDVTNEDLVSLFVAHEALAALEGSPLEASLRTGLRKVAEMMGGQVTLSWSNLERAVSHKRPGTLRKQDIARFEKVTRALLSNCELKFEYRKLGAPGQPWETRRVRPYHLAEVDHGWYIVGWDTNRDDHRTFAIQRMRNVTVLASRRFTVPSDFDPRDHFGGSFGIWSHDASEAEKYEVKIRLSGWPARVVPERQWHPSQDFYFEDPIRETGLIVIFKLGSLEEITRWVLGWGEHAEILDPPELIDAVRDHLARALRHYD